MRRNHETCHHKANPGQATQTVLGSSAESLGQTCDFQFPIIHINEALASHFSNVKMIDTSDNTSDDALSSLGDSAFEVLGDSAMLPSEDEEHDDTTDSLPSSDAHEYAEDEEDEVGDDNIPDRGTATVDTAGERMEPDMLLSDHQWLPSVSSTSTAFDQDSGTSSAATIRPPLEQSHRRELSVETYCISDKDTEVTRTIRDFSESETSEILQCLHVKNPPSKITAAVHQTLANQRLSVERPFRLLYTGKSWAKEEIVAKIGAALAVPMHGNLNFTSQGKSSRFNIIPVSSFTVDGYATPEVELIDSFGLELVVDECTSAEPIRDFSRSDAINLTVNDHVSCQSKWLRSGYHLQSSSNWELPDIALFFCSDDDDTETRLLRHHALNVMERHAVPSVVISNTPWYRRPTMNFTLNERSIHICLEACSLDGLRKNVLKRLPVDLFTFLNIDADQMNQNLACLTGLFPGGHRNKSAEKNGTSSIPPSTASVKDEHKNTRYVATLTSFAGRHLSICLTIAGILCLCAFMVSSFPGKNYQITLSRRSEQGVHVALPATSFTPSESRATTSSFTANHLSRDAGPSTKSIAVPNGIATAVSSISSAEHFSKTLASYFNPSDQFKIHVIGDSHVLLKPPQYFASLKSPPRLFVQVNRSDDIINAHCSKLFDGVYALDLEQEEAYGLLNISLWTESKPYLEQMFEVDFGSPRGRLARWKGAARNATQQLRTSLIRAQSDVHAHLIKLPTSLRNKLDQVAMNARQMQRRTESISNGNFPQAFTRALPSSERIKGDFDKLMNRFSDFSESLMSRSESATKRMRRSWAAYSRNMAQKASAIFDSMDAQGVTNSLLNLPRSRLLQKAHERAVRVWREKKSLRKSAA
ncbi:hypothetical protein L228DRAFT_243082 [Xylona heveae TC161]|uniref:Uncharacterized protein n=1 Tax=Xylona heveae (strain CBS 132557 / TC161) TaxID=1328760 RepID=A0A165JTC0_XYLHT|nr:hypothetical protein L228DRAFT_243082 [Xylona heveae TC161]KZF26598.1 hypothetical protein L228DRAFT_243082 [Xylona heveae TC161]